MKIGDVATRTGVNPATLRAWERRYGLLQPQRTPGGQRNYSGGDVARIGHVLRLLEEGWSVSAAAQRVLSDAVADHPPPRRSTDLGAARAALWAAVERLDGSAIDRVLDHALLTNDVAVALDEVVAPTLRRLGDEWHQSPRNIAREHVASHHLRARLVRMLESSTGHRGARCVAASPEGEQHDLGLIMASVVLAQRGWDVLVLGASTPWVSVEMIVDEVEPAVLLLGASRRPPVLALFRRWIPPTGPQLVLGGAGFQPQDVARVPQALLHTGSLIGLPTTIERALAGDTRSAVAENKRGP